MYDLAPRPLQDSRREPSCGLDPPRLRAVQAVRWLRRAAASAGGEVSNSDGLHPRAVAFLSTAGSSLSVGLVEPATWSTVSDPISF